LFKTRKEKRKGEGSSSSPHETASFLVSPSISHAGMLSQSRNKFVALSHILVVMASPETSGCSSRQNYMPTRVLGEATLTSGSEPNASLSGETRASSHLSQNATRNKCGPGMFLLEQYVTQQWEP
jgi:hypothetical protein